METEKVLQVDNDAAKKIRLLLALWDLGGLDTAVKKGDLNGRIVKKGEKSADYATILESLEKDDKAIERITISNRTQFRMTQRGEHTLVEGLKNKDLQVRTNTEKALLKLFLKVSTNFSTIENEPEMDFENFTVRFKEIYFEERKIQELRGGAVVIRSKEICQKFSQRYPISEPSLKTNFNLLKENDKIFSVVEMNEELIQWSE